jgi:hypothetical protein
VSQPIEILVVVVLLVILAVLFLLGIRVHVG